MDSQASQKPPSKLSQIESRVDYLLGLSARIKELSAKISDRLIGTLPSDLPAPAKDAKEPTGKLESIISQLDIVDERLKRAENDLKLIDKETE